MLPKLHIQAYQELLSGLQRLKAETIAKNRVSSIEEKFQLVQQIFQDKVINLSNEELDPAIASNWQSMQTEIHRASKLLSTDILFLRSSKQAATTEMRLKTLGDRTEKLIGYCQAILTFSGESKSKK